MGDSQLVTDQIIRRFSPTLLLQMRDTIRDWRDSGITEPYDIATEACMSIRRGKKGMALFRDGDLMAVAAYTVNIQPNNRQWKTGQYIWLDEVASRGSGCGKLLMQRLQRFGTLTALPIYLSSAPETYVRNFYKGLGFKHWDETDHSGLVWKPLTMKATALPQPEYLAVLERQL